MAWFKRESVELEASGEKTVQTSPALNLKSRVPGTVFSLGEVYGGDLRRDSER